MRDRRRTTARSGALLLVAALLTAPGCTYLDKYENFPGTPFTPDQPEAAVTLTGAMNSDPISVATAKCSPGGTVFWGTVTNTGDLSVADISIAIVVFDGAGGSLGTYRDQVYNGDVDDSDPDNPLAGTSLEVDKSGSFKVCTPVPFGAAARTEYRTTFTIIDEGL